MYTNLNEIKNNAQVKISNKYKYWNKINIISWELPKLLATELLENNHGYFCNLIIVEVSHLHVWNACKSAFYPIIYVTIINNSYLQRVEVIIK